MTQQRLSLLMFALDTKDGRNLAEGVTSVAERAGFDTEVTYGGLQFQLTEACFTKDVVVFDGSIEDEQHHLYHKASVTPALVDHFLVVGRTCLPINFVPAREGGAPDYPFPHFTEGLDRHRWRWSNDDILQWLQEQLADFKTRGPRVKNPDFHEAARSNDPERIARMMQDFYRASEPRTDTKDRIFFSYRSRCYEDALPLVNRLREGALHGGDRKQVRILPPGVLAYDKELLTAMRRWQLLALIDRMIAGAEELVAFDKCDYIASWWTQGELLTVRYRQLAGTPHPRVRYYGTARDALDNLPAGYQVSMTEDQRRRMARWYSHTDPLSMAPENVKMNRWLHRNLRRAPDFMLRMLLNRMAKAATTEMLMSIARDLHESSGGDLSQVEAMRTSLTDPKVIKEFYADPVWSEEFWEHPLVECSCQPGGEGGGGIDVGRFLSMNPPHLVRLKPEDVARDVPKGRISCPNCHGTQEVVAAAPRYLWAPLRGGATRTPQNTGLSRLPTYVLR